MFYLNVSLYVLSSNSPSTHPSIAFLKKILPHLFFPLSPVILCLSVSDLVLDSLSYTHTRTHARTHARTQARTHTHTKPVFPQVLKILENWLNFDVVFWGSGDVWNIDLWGWNGWNWSRSWNSTFRQYCLWRAAFYSHHAQWLTLFSSSEAAVCTCGVWCRVVLACCPRPDQNTHTHTACSISSKHYFWYIWTSPVLSSRVKTRWLLRGRTF